MKRMLASLTVLWLAAPVWGQAEPKPAEIVAPYVDEMTFVVGRVDIARVPIGEVIRHMENFTGMPAGGDTKEGRRVYDDFLRLGGKEAFFLLNIADGPHEVLGIVPLGAKADAAGLTRLLTDKSPLRVERRGDALLVGSPKAVESALARKAQAAPAVAKALAAVNGSAAQLVVIPPLPFLRAQEELVPNLPRELGGGPITVVTKGFQWAALGLDITPKLALKAVVQAADETAAQKLHSVVESALAHMSTQVEREVPMLVKVLPALKPKLEGDRLSLTLDDRALQSVLQPAVVQTRQAAQRQVSVNNMKQIALAMHNYHDTFKAFPARASLANEKPLLSWRVHILPFIEQEQLYRQFKLDEPWDSEHNKALIKQMPEIYKSPLAKNVAEGKTVYLVPVGKDTIFGDVKGMHIAKITDGTSNTILFAEANDSKAVFWTQPEDLKVTAEDPSAGLVRKEAKGFHVAFADGSVRMVSSTIAPKTLWALFTANQGEVIEEKE